jgi:signal transduction histidine kinase
MSYKAAAIAPGRGARSQSATPILQGGRLKAARAAWVILFMIGILILISALPGYTPSAITFISHGPAGQPTLTSRIFTLATGVASLGCAFLSLSLSWMFYRQRFQEPVIAALAFYLLLYGILLAGPMEVWSSFWLGNTNFALGLQGSLLTLPTFVLFAIFPNGRLVPHWTRWLLIAAIPLSVFLPIYPAFTASAFVDRPVISAILAAFYTILMVFGIYAQIYRYRHASTAEERQQTKWVVVGFGLWILYLLLSSIPYYYLTSLPAGAQTPWWGPASSFGWMLSLSIVPVSLSIAISRHRLWNIDIFINRALVYGALTIGIIGTYVVVIGGLGLLFRSSGGLILPLLATAAAAVLFQPLRDRLQTLVNRMMYGERDDPASVLAKLGDRLANTGSSGSTLEAIVDTVAQTLKLHYVAIELEPEKRIAASFGQPTDDVLRLPLVFQEQQIGFLAVSGRSPGEALTPKDLQLLEGVAGQAGAVAYNVNLTSRLRRAHQKLIAAREEERRRIRRDLHDGLGPQLASLSLKLEAAQNLLFTNPETAARLLDESERQMQDAVDDIRRLVYNLRPPALDELGLLSALHERARMFSGVHGPHIYIEGPQHLPGLPAAVEVAAYRIVQEALHNATRHGGAEHCWIRIKAAGALELEIDDDGRGLPPRVQPGVGINSMRERASELGGRLSLEARPGGGTRVQASLPLQQEVPDD